MTAKVYFATGILNILHVDKTLLMWSFQL